jgi:small multidrug resistance pump
MKIRWIPLLLGILFEVAGTVCMKLSDGFNNLVPSVLAFVFYGICLVFIVMVFKKMDVGIVYAIWASLGILFVALIGILWFKEPFTWIKGVSMCLIIAGICGLELFD